MVAGHRSLTYLHNINYRVNEKFRLNNLTLFDTEYREDMHNIFFIRNMLSYSPGGKLAFNAAAGVKNPGSFFTVSAQYTINRPTGFLAYSIGATYREGYTLEQSLAAEYAPYLAKDLQAYGSLLVIANITLKEYQRGLQFVRLGLKDKNASYGLALNLDQFNNNSKTLENAGIFFKYHL